MHSDFQEITLHRIYVITNTVSNKVYVGQTAQEGLARWRGHKKAATRGEDHPLYRAMRKHGIDKFTYEEISETADKDWANQLERTWIYFLKASEKQHGYVCTAGGDGRTGPNEELKRKRSNAARAQLADKTKHPKWRADLDTNEIARLHVDEFWSVGKLAERFKCSTTCINKRLRSLGIWVGRGRSTPESRKKSSAARIGMQFTEEHKANISKGKTGLRNPKRPDIVDGQVEDLYQYGFSTIDISRMFVCDSAAIVYRLDILGVPRRQQKKAA